MPLAQGSQLLSSSIFLQLVCTLPQACCADAIISETTTESEFFLLLFFLFFLTSTQYCLRILFASPII
jgi:hypothetical protein